MRVADNGYIVTGYLFLIYPNALRRTITNTNQKIEHQVGLGICRVTLWSEDPAWSRAGYSGDRGTAIRDVKEKPNTKRPRYRKQKIQSDKENTESQA